MKKEQTIRFQHEGKTHTYSFTPTDHEWICSFNSEGLRFDLNYHPDQSRIFVYRVEEKDGVLTTTYDKPIYQGTFDTLDDAPTFVLDTEEYLENLPMQVDSDLVANVIGDVYDMRSGTFYTMDDIRKLIWVAENILYWYPEISSRLSDAENAVFKIIVDKAQVVTNKEVHG